MTASTFHWSCKHTWRRSAKNTAWCLLGCAIGDFGTILFFQLTQIPFPVLGIMILAIINGLITSNDEFDRLCFNRWCHFNLVGYSNYADSRFFNSMALQLLEIKKIWD